MRNRYKELEKEVRYSGRLAVTNNKKPVTSVFRNVKAFDKPRNSKVRMVAVTEELNRLYCGNMDNKKNRRNRK